MRRQALVSVVVVFLAAQALAAPVAMVQFGSFETRAEADARATEVKQKHAGLIGTLDVGVQEVKMGGDLTVYRTQAGPVSSKAAAQSICSQLASNGDECYVVETALKSNSTPANAMANAVAAPVAGASNAVNAAPKAATNASPAAPVAAPAPAPSIGAPVPALSATVPSISGRDPSNMAALASIGATPANTLGVNDPKAAASAVTQDGTDKLPDAPQASPALQAAMDKAIAEEDSAQAAVAVRPAPQQQGFWSRMNPFANDTAAPAVAPAPVAAPVTAATEKPLLPPVTPTKPGELKPTTVKLASVKPVADTTAQAPVKLLPPVAAAAPEPAALAPVALAPTPASPPSLQLPPPPAPLRSVAMPRPGTVIPAPVLAAAPLPQVSAPGSVAPAPLMARPEPTGLNVPPPPSIAAVPGPNVRVEEAQRVPLTQANVPPPAPIALSPEAVPPNGVMSLSPSATVGLKTIWAQMGPFSDPQDALAFWDSYRMAHPDFPVVRVRVTSPVSSLNRGDATQWLRIGPFAREGFVSALCTTLVNADGEPLRKGLQCGRVVDMGVAGGGDAHQPGYLPGSRYKR